MGRVQQLKIVLMGRKPGAVRALDFLLSHGHRVSLVIPSDENGAIDGNATLYRAALARGLPIMQDDRVYEVLLDDSPTPQPLTDVDLVLSYLHMRRIRRPLIDLPSVGCFNFHPAPLPEFRGLGGYNFAILEGLSEYGVSVHWVAPSVDTGDIVKVRRFPIDDSAETALSLERKSQDYLFDLMKEFVLLVEQGAPIASIPQGQGRYIDRKEIEAAKVIRLDDSAEIIERKARAFWYPPYDGACIERNGARFTVVPPNSLKELSKIYQNT